MRLTEREKEILKLLYKGLNSSNIADRLCIARSTAKTHITNVLAKLNVHSMNELLAKRIEELENNQLSELSKNIITEKFLNNLIQNCNLNIIKKQMLKIIGDACSLIT